MWAAALAGRLALARFYEPDRRFLVGGANPGAPARQPLVRLAALVPLLVQIPALSTNV